MEQLRSVAEAAVRELQQRVREREAALEAAAGAARERQAAFMAQHAADRWGRGGCCKGLVSMAGFFCGLGA